MEPYELGRMASPNVSMADCMSGCLADEVLPSWIASPESRVCALVWVGGMCYLRGAAAGGTAGRGGRARRATRARRRRTPTPRRPLQGTHASAGEV